ncbi:hypothetical protein BDU57DRAFT_119023 [Ampelomyces quisqualis]|uniref:Uncharacterized protein n=1 Tax=Ampelomyces quisqualis TaxID=50730 RepID=A0A6A5QV73_AMPQU|nr:hypothetical protein BDU57DRAFT_119023 [Ampelomyces quisqualis]
MTSFARGVCPGNENTPQKERLGFSITRVTNAMGAQSNVSFPIVENQHDKNTSPSSSICRAVPSRLPMPSTCYAPSMNRRHDSPPLFRLSRSSGTSDEKALFLSPPNTRSVSASRISAQLPRRQTPTSQNQPSRESSQSAAPLLKKRSAGHTPSQRTHRRNLPSTWRFLPRRAKHGIRRRRTVVTPFCAAKVHARASARQGRMMFAASLLGGVKTHTLFDGHGRGLEKAMHAPLHGNVNDTPAAFACAARAEIQAGCCQCAENARR